MSTVKGPLTRVILRAAHVGIVLQKTTIHKFTETAHMEPQYVCLTYRIVER